MTEEILYQTKIKPWLSKQGVFYFRIEHKRIPDIYTCKNNIVTWYELKVLSNITEVLIPDWRPGQLAWIKEHYIKGGGNNIFLLLGIKQEVYKLIPKEFYNKGELNGRRFI